MTACSRWRSSGGSCASASGCPSKICRAAICRCWHGPASWRTAWRPLATTTSEVHHHCPVEDRATRLGARDASARIPTREPALVPTRGSRARPHRCCNARTAGGWPTLLQALECRVDLGGQEVEVELVGVIRVKRVKAEPFPPESRALGERAHDDGSACRLLVELYDGGEHVGDQRGPDSQ